MASDPRPYLLHRMTPMYTLRAKTSEKLAQKTAGWQAVRSQFPYLADVPLARYCWVTVTGEYSNQSRLSSVIKSCRYLGDTLVDGGQIYMSGNVGEHLRYEDLLAELYLLARASRDGHFWMRVVLHDEAQYGNFPLKIAKFLVHKGTLIIKDVRREGVEEQSTRLQQQLDDIAKKTKMLEIISRQIDADEAGGEASTRDRVKEFTSDGGNGGNGRRELTLTETNMVLDSITTMSTGGSVI